MKPIKNWFDKSRKKVNRGNMSAEKLNSFFRSTNHSGSQIFITDKNKRMIFSSMQRHLRETFNWNVKF